MNLKDILSAVIVLAVVVVMILLAAATYSKNQPLDAGWVTVITLVVGAWLGVKLPKSGGDNEK